jgi:hypothetical protein
MIDSSGNIAVYIPNENWVSGYDKGFGTVTAVYSLK